MAFATVSVRVRMESRNRLSWRHVFAIMIGVVGLLLAALYEIEAALWAAAYWWFATLNSPEEAILYFVDSIRTRGPSGFMVECHWQTMASLEATDGSTVWHQNGLHLHRNASRMGARDPPSFREYLVFLRADGVTAG